MKTTISQSSKKRQGATYNRINGKQLDRIVSHFKQTVELVDTGMKRKGKTLYHSITKHERI